MPFFIVLLHSLLVLVEPVAHSLDFKIA